MACFNSNSKNEESTILWLVPVAAISVICGNLCDGSCEDNANSLGSTKLN